MGLRAILSGSKSAFYQWVDSHSPKVSRLIQGGFPILISNQLRTQFRIMNLAHPAGPLPICDHEIDRSFYDERGAPKSEHQTVLHCGDFLTIDIAAISSYNASSKVLQVGYCLSTITPKGPGCYGSLRGYCQLRTPQRAASFHEHPYKSEAMGFFVSQWHRRKNQSYMFFHNVSWVPGKLSVQVCDRAGEPLMESGFKLLPNGSRLMSLKELLPQSLASYPRTPFLIRVKSSKPISSTQIYWDPESGLIPANHANFGE